MNTKNKAIVCILISAFGFSIMNLCVKLSGDLPSIEKSFFRNLVAAIIAFILLYRSKAGVSCKKENLPALILRAVLGTIGIFCNFYALSHKIREMRFQCPALFLKDHFVCNRADIIMVHCI